MDIILLMIAIFSNTGLAAQKGKSPVRWGFYTLLAFFLATIVFGGIYMAATYKGSFPGDFSITGSDIGAGSLPKSKAQEEIEAYVKDFQEDTLSSSSKCNTG